MNKKCSSCETEKDFECFYKRKASPDGLAYICKECDDKRHQRDRKNPIKRKQRSEKQRVWREGNISQVRNNKLLYFFNITLERYNEMRKEQNYCCYMCERHESIFRRALAVDHDKACCPGRRSCGKCIRGLLCDNCNRGLGLLGDNPETLERGATYLKCKKVG